MIRPILVILISAAFFAGCSHRPAQRDSANDRPGDAVAEVIRSADEPSPSENFAEVRNQPLEVWGQKLRVNKFDYPVIVNQAVEKWIVYFTGKGKPYFEKYLERGRYFIPEISKVLRAHKMPQDLVYLAMIESGFNNSAKSHARAVGPWQFIRQTGMRYGLAVNYWIDERRETKKATLAAIKYLSELYKEFGSWELAAAGYNAGEGKVRRAIKKYRTHNFWEIAKHRFFRHETRDYVPKIMAAAILTKNAEQFGFINPLKNKASSPYMISEKSAEPTPKELGEEIAKEDEAQETAEDTESSDADEKLADSDDDDLQDSDEDEHAFAIDDGARVFTPSTYMVLNPKEQIIEYSVKGPADLFAISKAAEVPYSAIKNLNPELLRWCTPPEMKTYRIKLPLSVKDKFLSTYNDDNFDRKVVFMQYKVRRGDDIRKVAHRFSVEADAIREINSFSKKSSGLSLGSVISLPVPTGYKRVIASMYDEKPSPERRRRSRRVRRRRTAELKPRHSQRVSRKYQRLRPSISATAKRSDEG